jgi:hypothetical protein
MSQDLTKDEILFQEIKTTFRLDTVGHLFNILLVMKNIKPGAYIVPKSKLKQNIVTFFEKYKLHYQIHDGISPDTLACFVSSNPITHNLIINNKLQHIAIGEFLGYECPLNINKNTSTFVFINITISYVKQNKKIKKLDQIYGYISNDVSKLLLSKLKIKAKKINKLGKHFPNLMPNLTCNIHGKFEI